jgi:hypothetical protein
MFLIITPTDRKCQAYLALNMKLVDIKARASGRLNKKKSVVIDKKSRLTLSRQCLHEVGVGGVKAKF